jgi:hypothetical protein
MAGRRGGNVSQRLGPELELHPIATDLFGPVQGLIGSMYPVSSMLSSVRYWATPKLAVCFCTEAKLCS